MENQNKIMFICSYDENSVRIVKRTFDLSFVQQWHDPWLTWDPSKYEGLRSVNTNPDLLWKPDIVLHNK